MKKYDKLDVVLFDTGFDDIKGIKPVYMTKGAAAADCATPLGVSIPPKTAIKIPLYIGFEIPEMYQIKMYPRSSLLIKKGLMQPVSIIDSDFSGNMVHCPIYNTTDEVVTLQPGERICQVQPERVIKFVSLVTLDNERDSKGFGGTGNV